MRLEALVGATLPHGNTEDLVLTAQWATFICWLDDRIDREGLGSTPGDLERFTAPLRRVLTHGLRAPTLAAPHTAALTDLWERTATGMPARWRTRFIADYTDFLDASEQEAAHRRARVRLTLPEYLQLRRRTITVLPMLDVLERTGHAPMVEIPRVRARVRDARRAVADIVGWVNDLASQADDAEAGHDNLVTVLARQERCATAVARAQVVAMIDDRRAGFRTAAAALRADLGPEPDRAADLGRYVDLVEGFLAATLDWLAVTGRCTPGPGPGRESRRAAPS
ncbi:hypothetical protein KBY55_08820 [Streptomyces sp. b94]|uniref:terpene synthase family protein n=1 Tax=Streptomyces sp. b94 TaxID=1827634 RepID=UPI001B3665F9|nr:terpene synthase family protein [Streptomyces sp. b94]MBQ1096189.1 hypothetical protein [Streptomyces sp. b94]